jgi:inosose dehydratase
VLTHQRQLHQRTHRPVTAQQGIRQLEQRVRNGMYRPLGTGDIDVAAIVDHLERNGYTCWYTLEQDTILTAEPRDEGPVTDVRTSADHVRDLLAKVG